MRILSKYLTISLLVFLIGVVSAEACDFEFDVIKGKKEVYNAGDEIVLRIEVIYTHRVCPIGIKNTDFKFDGLKYLGATKWKTLSANTFERKIKLKFKKSAKGGKFFLNATRVCDKTGGFGEIIFRTK